MTSGQSIVIWQKGHITSAHGRFSGIRQVAPVCTPPNTFPWAYTSQQPKQHLDQLSHFCTAHGRVSSGLPRHIISPKNCPFAWGDLDPHLIHGSLGPPESKSKTASWLVQPFLHSSRHRVAIYGTPIFPIKIDLSHGQIWPSSNTWFFRSTQILNQTRMWANAASHVQHISDLHSKFALGPRHV